MPKKKKKVKRKPKIKRFVIHVPVWDYYIHVGIGKNERATMAPIDKKLRHGHGSLLNEYPLRHGAVYLYQDYWIALWLKTIKDIPVLTHELLHIAFFVLHKRRDTPLCHETEESYAYFMEYLCQELLKKGSK